MFEIDTDKQTTNINRQSEQIGTTALPTNVAYPSTNVAYPSTNVNLYGFIDFNYSIF